MKSVMRSLVGPFIVLSMLLLAARAQQATKAQETKAQETKPQETTAQPAASGQATQTAQAPRRNPIPDTFTNLQVLPKDITKPELVRVMKSMSILFEKRCSYCHEATDDLSEADFAADTKETKKKARDLLLFLRDLQKRPAMTTTN